MQPSEAPILFVRPALARTPPEFGFRIAFGLRTADFGFAPPPYAC